MRVERQDYLKPVITYFLLFCGAQSVDGQHFADFLGAGGQGLEIKLHFDLETGCGSRIFEKIKMGTGILVNMQNFVANASRLEKIEKKNLTHKR